MSVKPLNLIQTLCAAIVPACTSIGPDASLLRAQSAFERLGLVGELGPLCEQRGDLLRYAGPSGAPLAECLERHDGVASLQITSRGGPVRGTLQSAAIVETMQLDIEVVGVCFSSCANYVVPAARSVSVAPFSAIVLHGGPDRDPLALRRQLRAALEQAGAPASAQDDLVEREVARALELRALHDRFSIRNGLSQGWFDLPVSTERIADAGARVQLAAVTAASPAFLTACRPNVEIARFWYPADRKAARSLEAMLALGPVRFLGLDRPEHPDC